MIGAAIVFITLGYFINRCVGDASACKL